MTTPLTSIVKTVLAHTNDAERDFILSLVLNALPKQEASLDAALGSLPAQIKDEIRAWAAKQ